MGFISEGQIFRGRYKIQKLIHKGRWSSTYKASDLRFPGRWWAVKEIMIVARDPVEKLKIKSKFQKEAMELSGLNQPSLVKIVDFVVENDNLYLVTEYVEGKSLQEIYDKSSGPLSEKQVINWAIQLANALHYIHFQINKPLYFRDIKPGNIMITSKGEVKLVDYGLGRVFEVGDEINIAGMGTMGYAAPEIFAEKSRIDIRSDVFTVGAILHQLLTKRDPTSTPFMFLPVGSLNPNASPYIEKIIEKATQYKPEDRHQSLMDLKKDLQHCLTRIMDFTPRVSALFEEKKENKSWENLWLIGLLILSIGILVTLWIFALKHFLF